MTLSLGFLGPIIDAALDAVVVSDASGIVRAWNQAAEDMFGWGRNEAVGRPMAELIVPEALREAHRQGVDRFLRTGQAHVLGRRIEVEARRRDGALFPVELAITRAEIGGETMFVGYLRDISARREAEERLRASEARLAEESDRLTTLLENLPVGVCFVDTDGKAILSNPAYRRYVPENVLPSRLPDAEERWVAYDAAGRRLPREEFVGLRALRGESLEAVEFLHHGDSGPTWTRISGVPLRDAGGAVIAAILVITNIDDLKRAQQSLSQLNETLEQRVATEVEERAKAEAALRQSQKMEAIGQLTGGVAHDFNNLLTPIIGGLDLLQRSPQPDERARRLIAGALSSAERARTLVQRLLAFASRQPLQPRPIDVARVVHDMAELIGSTTGPQVRVTMDAVPGVLTALAEANQLEMAILNLAVNARDAMPHGGRLHLSVRKEHGSDQDGDLRAGSYVVLSVADTGVGMDEATLRRAAEPFFSTKGLGKGTGLGLSMIHGLAAQLGGALRLHSAPGRGTTVELWLPQAHGEEEDPAVTRGEASSSHSGVVLLVDDEALVRASTAEMLASLGFEVVQAGSAEEARELLDDGLEFGLLVTDHLMPGMSGIELADLTLEARPETRVLIISGYAELEALRRDLPRLTKPFTLSELDQALRNVLNGDPGPGAGFPA